MPVSNMNYETMFNLARTVGKRMSKKNACAEVYKVETVVNKVDSNGESYQVPLNYFASFKDGKPFKIVQKDKFNNRGLKVFNHENNTIIDTSHDSGYFRRIVSDATTEVQKGRVDLYVNNGKINFAAIMTPEKQRTGQSLENGSLWRDNGFGYGPYSNIKHFLKEFNKKLNS